MTRIIQQQSNLTYNLKRDSNANPNPHPTHHILTVTTKGTGLEYVVLEYLPGTGYVVFFPAPIC